MPTTAADSADPVFAGPTWERTEAGKWRLPAQTLGWQCAAWAAECLIQPDGPQAGEPWDYTNEQLRFLLWWYAVDKAGRFVYRSGMLRRIKGWGKDPFAATLCAFEFVGPCRFSHFDEDGLIPVVGKNHPAAWVQIAAVSKDQTRNTMTLFPGLFSKTAIRAYSIDLGKEIIYAHQGRCRLEAVTSSPRALEGGRTTFTLKNETQHWLAGNDGHAMSDVIARNATKSRDGAARALAISNAHQPGENSDAEHDYEAWRKVDEGLAQNKGFLYDSLEAPAGLDIAEDADIRAGLQAARGDSHWLDEDRHVEEILDPRNTPSSSRRFYFNQVVAPEDFWLSKEQLEAGARGEVPAAKERIVVGVDGARFVDGLALIATSMSGYQWPLGIWERPEHADDDYEHPMDEVDSVMVDAFERWDVWRVYIDPGSSAGNIAPLVEKWQGRWGVKRVIEWYMNRLRQTAFAVAKFEDGVKTGAWSFDGDPVFRRHILNAVRRPTKMVDDEGKPLFVISKDRPGSPRKMDGAAAGVLSWEAFGDCVAAGENVKRVYRRAGFS